MADGGAEQRIRDGLDHRVTVTSGGWLMVVAIGVALVLVAAAVALGQAVGEVRSNQDEAKRRGCLLLAENTNVSDDDLERVGCPRRS